MSALALELIAKAKAEKWTYLDLGRCGLVTLPRELFELVELEELILSDFWWDYDKGNFLQSMNPGTRNQLSNLEGNWLALLKISKLVLMGQPQISDLSPLADLTALQVLDCSDTSISDLSPLANLPTLQTFYCSDTSISDLSPLANLTALQTFYCSNTSISDLSPLANLPTLRKLNCYRTSIYDLSPLANLPVLQVLNCSDTSISDLGPLANLTTLRKVYCYRTSINDLNQLSNLTTLQLLDCSDTSISDLSPLINLTALQALYCHKTSINDLSPLANLAALRKLYCSETSISDLSPLVNLTTLRKLYCSNTSISDLSPLSNLIALDTLYCSNTSISDLSPLANLIALDTLDCSETSISDLSPLTNLIALDTLYCSGTLISDLSPLSNLAALEVLLCSETEIIDLSPLANLIALKRIHCDSETITHIPKHILFLPQLRSIFFSPTVRNIPPGLTELKDIRAYFRHLEQEISPAPDQLFKVVLLGNGCVGKTSLLARLEHGQAATLPTLEARTHAIQMKQWPVPQSELVANVWDFGGQEIYHATHRLFLASRALYLVLWSGEHVREAGEAYYDLPYWLDLILAEGRHNRVLVIQNRFGDEPTQLPPDWHDLVAYYEARHLVLERPLSVDCCQNEGLEQVRKQIRRSLEDMQEQRAYQLPAAWVGIRAHLLAERENGTKVLPFSAFRAQYQALGMDDAAAHALLQFLHHNGIVYHQSHRLNDDIILNQQ